MWIVEGELQPVDVEPQHMEGELQPVDVEPQQAQRATGNHNNNMLREPLC